MDTKHITKAAVLAYKPNSSPKILTSGREQTAKEIAQKAQEFGVPLFSNELLVDSLLELPLDSQIPPELCKAIVDVFAWIIDTEQKAQLSKE